MTRKKYEVETDDSAALAAEAARLEANKSLDDSSAVESATLSDVALTNADIDAVAETPISPLTDAEIVAEIPAFEPPPWTVSKEIIPQWVIAAQRIAWMVDAIPVKDVRTEEPRARWTSTDIDYRYFKGGHVLATFHPDSKHGPVFGVLKTEPVAAFDADPEPPAAT